MAWWHPDFHRDRAPVLRLRDRIKRALRYEFERQGFFEVETGCLQVSPGNESHLAAFAATGQTAEGYLHTSPEFACKKLLAAGEPRIFTFAHAFRDEPVSRLHLPEFIMLEWYRAGAGFGELLIDLAMILRTTVEAGEISAFQYRGHSLSAGVDCQTMTVCEAFDRFAGIDLDRHLSAGAERDAFAALAREMGHTIADDDTWSDIFAKVLTRDVEPRLGLDAPTLLTHYPVSEAALAQVSPEDSRVAERVELYLCGVEIANGFAELTDADEQRRRFEVDMAEMDQRYGRRHPIDEEFLAAVALMPPAIGCALGFDRLVMLAAGAPRLSDVVWTPPSNVLLRRA